MNDDEIRSIALGIAARGGMIRLLGLLGFHGALRTGRRLPCMPPSMRSVRTAARQTLHVHVLDLRDSASHEELRGICRGLRESDPLVHHLVVVSEPRRRRVLIACDALGDGLRHIVLEPSALRTVDIDTLRDLAAVEGESGTAAALRIHRALDRRRLTARFFRDVRGVRDAIARAWTGLPTGSAAERDALALLFLSRLMFLYFLQRRGLLASRTDYLPHLLARWRRRGARRRSMYGAVLRTLFFGVLNRAPERRTANARSLGRLPYLNGGLFEKHRIEMARPALDLPDDVVAMTFDALLEKYRFTSGDTAAGAPIDGIGAGIDPEMLGRIFEGLMPGDRRSRTGTFYTPADAVDGLVVDALAAHMAADAGISADIVSGVLRGEACNASDLDLVAIGRVARGIRVLDPACGSGAFLLGALARLERAQSCARSCAPPDPVNARRGIVAESLHGVDLLEDAALICSLRLWLSLIPDCHRVEDVPPLPNLDRRIRQGDALVDPLDIGSAIAGRPLAATAPRGLRSLLSRLEPAAREYITSGPDTRPALRRALARLERRLARAWLDALQRQIEYDVRDLSARAADLDLFGAPTSSAHAARAKLRVMTTRLDELNAFRGDLSGVRTLPFFSFRVHFAGTDGFDVVLSNPPWVRAHNWPPAVRQLLRDRYRVCALAGWPHATTLTSTPAGAGAQVDLAFLFLERSVDLLRAGGTLGMVLPAKLIRSLAPGGARSLLLTAAHVLSIRDHSLDQRAIFDADAFTTMIVARRARHDGDAGQERSCSPQVHVRMTRGDGSELRFDVPRAALPLRPGDDRSPWLLAPPECASAFRAMQISGPTVADAGLSVRRGAMTGANDVMIVQDVQPKLGDLARIRTEGYYRRGATDRRRFGGYVEASALRPVLRGTDVQAWRTSVERHVLWTPYNEDRRSEPPRRLHAFLRRHSAALESQNGHPGALHRLSRGLYGHKVVWSDLAADLRAAAVPASIRSIAGTDTPVLPLNTVYFIPTTSDRDAHLLAAYFNSLPLRTFARAMAERAKDAHFRFFAWTIAMLPLPRDFRCGATADRLVSISREAHCTGTISSRLRTELDTVVARAYRLSSDQVRSIAGFDAWLGGKDARP